MGTKIEIVNWLAKIFDSSVCVCVDLNYASSSVANCEDCNPRKRHQLSPTPPPTPQAAYLGGNCNLCLGSCMIQVGINKCSFKSSSSFFGKNYESYNHHAYINIYILVQICQQDLNYDKIHATNKAQ